MTLGEGCRFCIKINTAESGSPDDLRPQPLDDTMRRIHDEATAAAELDQTAWETRSGRGGILFVLPSTTPEPAPRLIDDYTAALNDALARHNQRRFPEARLRLQLAMHAGAAFPVGGEYTGQAVTMIDQLLVAAPLRELLSAAPMANLALALSDRLYQDNVKPQFTKLRPEEMRSISARVNGFAERAWAWIPGVAVHQLVVSPAERRKSQPA